MLLAAIWARFPHCVASLLAVPRGMDGVQLVPDSPPAALPEVASLLVDAGWPMEAGPVGPVAAWLHENGVRCKLDFVGLDDVQLIPGAAELSEEAIAFLQTLVTSAECRVVTWSAPIVHTDRPKRYTLRTMFVGLSLYLSWQESGERHV